MHTTIPFRIFARSGSLWRRLGACSYGERRGRTLLLLILCPLLLSARSLVLTLMDGTQVSYVVTDSQRPVMAFKDGKMTVRFRSFAISSIREFRLTDDDVTGIAGVSDDVTLADGCLMVPSGVPLQVYDGQGRRQNIDIVCTPATQTVNLSRLPRGMYVIHAGTSSFKYLKH